MPVPLWRIILQIILILIVAVFSGAETAVMSLNEKKTEKLADDGDKKSKKLLKMLGTPEKFLTAIRISITFVGFLGAAFAADSFAGVLAEWLYSCGIDFVSRATLEIVCIAVVTLILSYLMIVFGELVPKRIAMKRPEKTARAVCGIVSFALAIAGPAVSLLMKATNLVLRLFRIDPKDTEEEVTEEEIRLLVDAGEEDGNIESDEKEMIENVFEFNNILASDVMVHRTEMTAIDIESTSDEVFDLINESGYSRFPVYEENIDNIVGILSGRTFLLDRCGGSPKTVRELIYEPYFVPESVRADVLFRDMQTKKTHMAVVLDEYGGTSGLVTLEDLIEQIVGNIYDETDDVSEDHDIEKIGENLWRMQGSTELEIIEEELGIDFPEEDDELTTLSGLIFSRFTTIPADGETPELDVDGLHIKVEEITEHRVASAIVELLPEEENGSEDEKNDD